MPFALQLREMLRFCEKLVPAEFAKGEPLESVLDRHLMAVEVNADSDMVTSILLLEGTTLHHGAAPRLPRAYVGAIDGLQIGPAEGSCGTAAFHGRPIYVGDITNDPLWEKYRDLALGHGLRACWSTPIHNEDGRVIGTFAIYHKRPRSPTKDEVESIKMITGHVARAIMWYRGPEHQAPLPESSEDRSSRRPKLRLVSDSDAPVHS